MRPARAALIAAAAAAAAGRVARLRGGAQLVHDDEDADRMRPQQRHDRDHHHDHHDHEHGHGSRGAAEADDGDARTDGGDTVLPPQGAVPIELIRVGAMVSIAGIKVAFAFAPLRFRTNPGLLGIAVEAFGELKSHGGHDHDEHHHHHDDDGGCGSWRPYVLSDSPPPRRQGAPAPCGWGGRSTCERRHVSHA
eukprot:gene51681-62493_t